MHSPQLLSLKLRGEGWGPASPPHPARPILNTGMSSFYNGPKSSTALVNRERGREAPLPSHWPVAAGQSAPPVTSPPWEGAVTRPQTEEPLCWGPVLTSSQRVVYRRNFIADSMSSPSPPPLQPGQCLPVPVGSPRCPSESLGGGSPTSRRHAAPGSWTQWGDLGGSSRRSCRTSRPWS